MNVTIICGVEEMSLLRSSICYSHDSIKIVNGV